MFHFPQMANSNSITHSFASKAALSAATSLNRVRMRNIFTFKSFASFFSCLSWKEVALGHLHIYTATDPQKLIVNKLPTFCWGHIFISWGGKSWMLIFQSTGHDLFHILKIWCFFDGGQKANDWPIPPLHRTINLVDSKETTETTKQWIVFA